MEKLGPKSGRKEMIVMVRSFSKVFRRAALLALAVLYLSEFGPTLRAQTCVSGLTKCCESFTQAQAHCIAPGCNTTVNFQICPGGQHDFIYAESACYGCCASQVQSWFSAGYCAAPGQARSHVDVREEYLVFVRGCDGRYALSAVDVTS